MTQSILVVDDDELVRITIEAMLTREGYAVVSCVSGAEAQVAVKKQEFDLVIMDIQMPDQSGLDAVKEMRQFEQANGRKKSSVLFLTGFSDANTGQQAKECGGDGLIVKPFEIAELLRSVQERL